MECAHCHEVCVFRSSHRALFEPIEVVVIQYFASLEPPKEYLMIIAKFELKLAFFSFWLHKSSAELLKNRPMPARVLTLFYANLTFQPRGL